MAWEGVNFFFQNQECVNILGCSVTFFEYKNVFWMLVDNVCTIQALFVTKPLHYYLDTSAEGLINSTIAN